MNSQSSSDRMKWFETAFNDKFPDTSIDDLCKTIQVDPSAFRNLVAQSMAPDAMSGYVLEGILGCNLNDFVEEGRRLHSGGQPPEKKQTGSASAGDDDEWLARAGSILKRGGENAATLKNIIRLMDA
ncbi:hypothetical protein C4J81_18225 [Deltaproteobacteria bacterium Smac51]|nr:hypothetical protein C4J81_18225 [Deltaproteobacteria bacterium Smac51]